jgi:hypothetical protein
MDDPLLLVTEQISMRIDTPASTPLGPDSMKLDIREDLYKLNFSKKPHLNFIGTDKFGDQYVLSVLQTPASASLKLHSALLTHKKQC